VCRDAYFIDGKDPLPEKPGKIFYLVYRNQEGKQVEE